MHNGPHDPAEIAALLRAGELSAHEVCSSLIASTANALAKSPRPLRRQSIGRYTFCRDILAVLREAGLLSG